MQLAGRLLTVLVPPICLDCRQPTEHCAAALCADCRRALPWLREQVCRRCGLPSHRDRPCAAANAHFERAWAPLAYEGPTRAMIRSLKQRNSPVAVAVMGAQLAANLPADLRQAHNVLVPVPAHRLRGRQRGFNPAFALASELAARTPLPLRPCLRRTDWSPRQAGARAISRRASDRIAVELTSKAPRHAILVDDVHTTGATLDPCAQALRAGGSRFVAAIAYARAL